MTNIRYVGAETSTEAFGKTFMAAEWTDESGLDDYAVETLRGNPQFMVTDDKPAKAARVEAESAPVEEPPPDTAPHHDPADAPSDSPPEPAPVTLGGVDFDPNAPTPVEATDEPNPAS